MSVFRRKSFWYWVYICLMLVVFTFLVPPLQKPDEPLHFKRASALAKGQILCLSDREHERGFFRYPESIETFPEHMFASHIIMNPDGKFPIALYKTKYPLSWNGDQKELTYNCVLTVPSYIPQTLGILMSIPFNSVLISFFLARVFSAIFYGILLFLALRITVKPYQYLVALVGGFPMALFLGSSVSYDSLSIALGILLFSYLTRLYGQKSISVKMMIGFMAVALTFILIKPGYYFTLVLPFLFVFSMKKTIGIRSTLLLFISYLLAVLCSLAFVLTIPI